DATASASARVASMTGAASGEPSVSTARLWSASACTSSSAGPVAAAIARSRARSRPSDTLTTHSSTRASVGSLTRANPALGHPSGAGERGPTARRVAPRVEGCAPGPRVAAVRLLGRGGTAPAVRDDRRLRARRGVRLGLVVGPPVPRSREVRRRVFIGGKGDRLLGVVAELADGWNTCWTWTPRAYRERLDVLDRACEKVGRDPATVWRSLGLYALCGEDEGDLARRFERMTEEGPPGVLRGVDLAAFRNGRLVGTVEQVREQAAEWESRGVDTLIAGVGAVPFHVSSRDDVEMLGHALGG